MSVGAIGGTTSATTTSSGGLSAMNPADFLKVMMSELQNQDPFQPQDSSKLLEQLSSLQNVQSQMSLQSTLQSLVLQYQIASAGSMIGKLVAGTDDANNPVTGLVTAVSVQNGKALLQLDSGKTLAMERVTQIAPQLATTAAAA